MLLGLVVAIIGWFNIKALGKVGIGITIAGSVLAFGTLLVTMIAPGLLDTLSSALQIVKDVPRDPSMFPIPGGEPPETTDFNELVGRGQNQHELTKVRKARPH